MHINRSRMDAGSYSKKIINVVDKYSKMFYIRANKSADMFKQIREITDCQNFASLRSWLQNSCQSILDGEVGNDRKQLVFYWSL